MNPRNKYDRSSIAIVAVAFLVVNNVQPLSTYEIGVYAEGVLLLILYLNPSKFVENYQRRIYTPAILIFAISASSIIWSASPNESFQVVPSYLLSILLALRLARMRINLIGWGLWWGAFAVMLLSWIAAIVAPQFAYIQAAYKLGALQGVLGHSNSLALVTVFGIALTIALWSQAAPRARIYLGLAFVAFVFTGLQTRSSAGLLVILLVLLTFLLLKTVNRIRASARFAIFLVSFPVILLVGFYAADGLFAQIIFLSGRDLTFTGRSAIWESVVYQIAKEPILGYGLGGVWGPVSQIGQQINHEIGFIAAHSHNGYLEILLAFGFVGLALFLWMTFSALVHTTKLAFASRDYYWLVLMLVPLLTFNLSESLFLRDRGIFLLTLIAASSFSASRGYFSYESAALTSFKKSNAISVNNSAKF